MKVSSLWEEPTGDEDQEEEEEGGSSNHQGDGDGEDGGDDDVFELPDPNAEDPGEGTSSGKRATPAPSLWSPRKQRSSAKRRHSKESSTVDSNEFW